MDELKVIKDRIYMSGEGTYDAAMKADTVEFIIKEMREGISHFWFEKKDYSTREAYGTRAECILQQLGGELPDKKDENRNREIGLVSFFDCTKKEWRCFRPECVISVDFSYNEE